MIGRKWSWHVMLLAVLLAASLLRLYQLDAIPPGLHRDEAYNGLDVLRVLRTGELPVFFEANEGREPFFLYLQTITVWLWGNRAWSLRIAAAFVGIVTLPLLYRLGVELFDSDRRARWLGILAASWLAVSYWHTQASRSGLRAICLPAFSILTIWFFWRGWQSGRYRDWLVSGVALGATMYTYTAGRLLPIVLVAFFLLSIIFLLPGLRGQESSDTTERDAIRRRNGLILLVIAASFVAAPLGFFFWTNPIAFSLHQDQLAVFNPLAPSWEGLSSLAANGLAVLRMFIDRGDPWIAHNIPGRPALDILAAAGFWVGLIVAIWRFRSPVNALLIVWLVMMLVPTIMTDPAPSNVRAIGALPPIFLLTADGWMRLWGGLTRRLSWGLLVILVLGAGGFLTARDYASWASSPEVFREFDAGIVTLARHARVLAASRPVMMPLRLYGQPAPQFLLASDFSPTQAMSESVENQELSFLALKDDRLDSAVVILRRAADGQGQALVPRLLTDSTLDRLRQQMTLGISPVVNRAGKTIGAEMTVGSQDLDLQPLQPEQALSIDFGNQMRLVGYDLSPRTIAPNQKVNLVLYWQSLGELRRRYRASIAFRDTRDFVWSLTYREPWEGNFSTDLWRRGETLPDVYTLRVPAKAHPGKYQFDIGMVRDRLPEIALDVTEGLVQRPEDQVTLGTATVRLEPQSIPVRGREFTAHFGDPTLITLLGYNSLPQTFHPGDPVSIELVWRGARQMDTDYTVFMHLTDQGGHVIAQHDGQPQQGDSPTSLWFQNELVSDLHELSLSPDLEPGTYFLQVGLYDLKTGERLATFDATGHRQAEDQVLVRQILVTPMP